MSIPEKPYIENLNSCFGYVEAVIEHLSKDACETALVPDSPMKNTGKIDYELGIDLKDEDYFRLNGVAGILTMLLNRQVLTTDGIARAKRYGNLEELQGIFDALSNTKAAESGKDFECALTRYKGKACVYIVLPPDTALDYGRLKKDLAKLKTLLKEVKLPEENPLSSLRRGSAHCFGPFDADTLQQAQQAIALVGRFHGLDGAFMQTFAGPEGKAYLTADAKGTERLLQKEQLSLMGKRR